MFILVWQLVMQYLYFGGTEALHIRNTDVMEVRSFFTASTENKLVQSLNANITSWSIIKCKTDTKLKILTIFPASVCSQVLPAGGAAEAL